MTRELSTKSTEEYDAIVIGAGVNGLVSAAYLAKAGAKTLVVEEKDIIGGGCTTQELNVPSFRHDVCATVHDQIQDCPLFTEDELGLFSSFGLKYLYPDPMLVSIFRDNKRVIQYQSVQKTIDDVAKLSQHDAQSYKKVFDYWDKTVRPPFVASRQAPPVPPSQFYGNLEKTPEGREMMTQFMMSALELVDENFEDDHVKSHLLRLTTAGGFPSTEHNLGWVLYSLVFNRHSYHWGFPEGGAQGLPDSLRRCIQHYEGQVMTSSPVRRVLVENGTATGIELGNGKQIRAKRAVISSIHPKTLFLLMLDEKWVSEDLRNQIGRLKFAMSEYVIHLALKEAPNPRPEYKIDGAVLYGTPESTEAVVDEFVNLDRNRIADNPRDNPLQILDHAYMDSKRAPNGGHTFNVSNYAPYNLNGNPQNWERIKMNLYEGYVDNLHDYFQNVGKETIIGYSVFTPLDFERHDSSFLEGTPFGLGYSPWQSGYMRPLPTLSGYRTPIKGLYLTGASTWPGAAIQGHPGRNTARVVMQDLGIGA